MCKKCPSSAHKARKVERISSLLQEPNMLNSNPLTTNGLPYINQSTDLLYKPIDWFLYDGNIGR